MTASAPQSSGLIPQMLLLAASYFESGKMAEAETTCRQVMAMDPKNAEAPHILGVIAAQAERYDEAAELFEQAIKAKKNVAIFYYHLALALQKQGNADEAVKKYRRAIAIKPDYAEAYNNIGAIFRSQGKWSEAIFQFERAIAVKPDYAEAYNDLGALLKELGRHAEALTQYMKAVIVRPGYALARFNLANSLRDDGLLDDAVEQYERAISLEPNFMGAHVNLGDAFKKLGRPADAVGHYERALSLAPDSPGILGNLVHELQHICAWDKLSDYQSRLLEMVRQEREDIPVFSVLCLPTTAAEQLTGARAFCREKKEAHPPAVFHHAAPRKREKIRIGYLSADFHPHATTYLMAELFERHDRTRFEVTGYSYGREDASDMRQRLLQAFDHFVDLRQLTDRDAAQRIYDDGIDILIDLKGYTEDSRIGIPAHRPAPVQVNYVGYPGTMGVDFIDYILADSFILPVDQQSFFSEKIVQLPDCYQPNDTTRRIDKHTPTRADCGLPEQGFVFCCFNNTYKITPQVFDIWMRLLQGVPGSVLWLLEANASVKENLQREAVRRGIDAGRLVFAPKMPLHKHLARHRLADLFLDTLPVNAHTTASDALWAGLPVLTCAGDTLVSRVAGSLLSTAGLPELITYSLEDYEALALQLAQNPARLSEIRQKLTSTRLETPLFNIERLVWNIEKAYTKMWQTWQSGEAPSPFAVTNE